MQVRAGLRTGPLLFAGSPWYFVLDLPQGPDGRRRQKKQRGFPTKKAAQTAMAEVVTRVDRGTHSEPGRRRLSEYLEEWIEGLAVSRENSTVENYANVLRSWVIPRIGGLRLSAVEPGHLRKLYAELLKEGAKSGRPLSARSVSLAHRVVHRALEDAVADGLLPRNPAASVKRPATASSAAGAVWSADEARRFLAAVTGERLEPLWRLELNTWVATRPRRRCGSFRSRRRRWTRRRVRSRSWCGLGWIVSSTG
ncbi:MAG: Arm DNA-binding domain-containing protein [Acidimicrobiia bacterium]